MRPLIPSKRGSLDSAQAHLSASLDLVELWKSRIRSKLARRAELEGAEPKMRIHIDFRVILFAAAFGLAGGPFGAIRSLVTLLSVLLVHETSRAALARWLGRSARVTISLAGGQTELSGPALRGAAAFGFTVVGSLANVLLALVLHARSRYVHDPAWALVLRDLGTAHAIWGIAQALPLVPFRAGTELARRLPSSFRLGHALASGGLAVAAVFIFRLPNSPFLLVGLLFIAISAARAAHEAFKADFDRRSGIASKLDEAGSALKAGNHRQAMAIARTALELSRSNEQRQGLWSTVAWAGIGDGDPFAAHAGLQHLTEASLDVHLLASYLVCCNRTFEAQQLLLEARQLGNRSPETSKLLIEVLFAQGDLAGALAVTDDDVGLLSEQDRRAALFALATASEPKP